MKSIDSNMLAAYLEGSLEESDARQIEQAIEQDDELKFIVDEWVSMADVFLSKSDCENDRESINEACRNIGSVMTKAQRSDKVLLLRMLMVASLFAFVSVTAIWLFVERGGVDVQTLDQPMGVEVIRDTIITDTCAHTLEVIKK